MLKVICGFTVVGTVLLCGAAQPAAALKGTHLVMNEPSTWDTKDTLISLLATPIGDGAKLARAHEVCASSGKPRSAAVVHRCLLRIAPKMKKFERAAVSLLCADAAPVKTYINSMRPAHWGHSFYLLGRPARSVPRGSMCLARVGSKWGRRRLRTLERRPIRRADRQVVATRVAGQLRRRMEKYCDEVGGGDKAKCRRWIARSVRAAQVGLYAAKLPGRRIGIAVVLVPRDPGKVLQGPLEATISIDARGTMVDELGLGWVCTQPGCGHIRAIGDLDGDGYDDILIDNRGGYMQGMGSIELIRWRRGRRVSDTLMNLSGG